MLQEKSCNFCNFLNVAISFFIELYIIRLLKEVSRFLCFRSVEVIDNVVDNRADTDSTVVTPKRPPPPSKNNLSTPNQKIPMKPPPPKFIPKAKVTETKSDVTSLKSNIILPNSNTKATKSSTTLPKSNIFSETTKSPRPLRPPHPSQVKNPTNKEQKDIDKKPKPTPRPRLDKPVPAPRRPNSKSGSFVETAVATDDKTQAQCNELSNPLNSNNSDVPKIDNFSNENEMKNENKDENVNKNGKENLEQNLASEQIGEIIDTKQKVTQKNQKDKSYENVTLQGDDSNEHSYENVELNNLLLDSKLDSKIDVNRGSLDEKLMIRNLDNYVINIPNKDHPYVLTSEGDKLPSILGLDGDSNIASVNRNNAKPLVSYSKLRMDSERISSSDEEHNYNNIEELLDHSSENLYASPTSEEGIYSAPLATSPVIIKEHGTLNAHIHSAMLTKDRTLSDISFRSTNRHSATSSSSSRSSKMDETNSGLFEMEDSNYSVPTLSPSDNYDVPSENYRIPVNNTLSVQNGNEGLSSSAGSYVDMDNPEDKRSSAYEEIRNKKGLLLLEGV